MISLLVPVRGEEPGIAEAFGASSRDFEIIVAADGDAGSAGPVFERIGARLLRLPGRNRGTRLAIAARESRGGILAFLHADSRLPPGAREAIEDAVRRGASWGAFRLAYDRRSIALAWIAWWANVRTRVLRLPFGDQGIFCTRDAYDRAGGYPELAVCDDLAFALRLGRAGRFRLVPAACTTSARAYAARPAARVLRNWIVIAGYFLGVRPETLERWYRGRSGPKPS